MCLCWLFESRTGEMEPGALLRPLFYLITFFCATGDGLLMCELWLGLLLVSVLRSWSLRRRCSTSMFRGFCIISSIPLSKHRFSTSTKREQIKLKTKNETLTKSPLLRRKAANKLLVVLGNTVPLFEVSDFLRCLVSVQNWHDEIHEYYIKKFLL